MEYYFQMLKITTVAEVGKMRGKHRYVAGLV